MEDPFIPVRLWDNEFPVDVIAARGLVKQIRQSLK